MDIITIFRYVKAVEGRTIPKTDYFQGGDNEFVSCSYRNGKGFHGKRRRLPTATNLLVWC